MRSWTVTLELMGWCCQTCLAVQRLGITSTAAAHFFAEVPVAMFAGYTALGTGLQLMGGKHVNTQKELFPKLGCTTESSKLQALLRRGQTT